MTPAEHAIWTTVYALEFSACVDASENDGDTFDARYATRCAIERACAAVEAFRTFEPIAGDGRREVEMFRAVRGR